MYFLYVLKSIQHHRTYIGISGDISKRLAEHNNGSVRSTKYYRPYQLIHFEVYGSKKEARVRELSLKNNSFEKERLFKMLSLL